MKKTIYSKKYQNVVDGLKDVRTNLGLTQKEVSLKLRKPQSYISKIERGERRLDIVELEDLAKIYNKNITYFI